VGGSVCVYVCMYVYMYVCMYACRQVATYVGQCKLRMYSLDVREIRKKQV
jgi:hypothetical protein